MSVDAANHCGSDRHFEQCAGRSHFVAFDDFQVVAEDDDADRTLFQIERQPADLGAGEFDHLAGHDAGQAVDAGDAVPDFQHFPHLTGFDLLAVLLDLLLEDADNFISV